MDRREALKLMGASLAAGAIPKIVREFVQKASFNAPLNVLPQFKRLLKFGVSADFPCFSHLRRTVPPGHGCWNPDGDWWI